MTGRIRLATWNLNRPRSRSWKRNPLLLQQLAAIDADIWILTETNQSIALPGYNSASTNATASNNWLYLNQPHTEGENATTILSRWTIRKPTLPTFDDTIAVCADIDTPFGPLRVYGTIITWHADRGADGVSRNWEEHYRAIAAHSEDWAKLRGTMPLIAAGDFNVSLGDSYYGTNRGRELLLDALKRNELSCASTKLPATIDHICLPAEWTERVVHTERWPRHTASGAMLSDHCGTTVDIAY